jgi:hypothetical protein
MKKTVALTFLMLICMAIGHAQTAKMEVFELNAQADIVLTGKITLLDAKNFTVGVEQVLAGDFSDKTVVVERFHNTKTVKRWGKYLQGELVMLWLKNDAGTYKIVGENGEGEKLVFNGEVYLDSRGGGLKNTFGNQAPYPTLNIYAEKVKADDFFAAVKDTKGCFSLDIEEKKSPTGEVMYKRFAVKKLEDKQYDDIRGRGWMHDLIIANGEKHIR